MVGFRAPIRIEVSRERFLADELAYAVVCYARVDFAVTAPGYFGMVVGIIPKRDGEHAPPALSWGAGRGSSAGSCSRSRPLAALDVLSPYVLIGLVLVPLVLAAVVAVALERAVGVPPASAGGRAAGRARFLETATRAA